MKIAHNRVIASAFYTKNSHLLQSFHFSGMKKAAIHKRIVAAVRVCPVSYTHLHELLHALALGAGVVVAVTFQQVDNAPDTETGTERDNEGLKNGDCLFKKCHIVC